MAVGLTSVSPCVAPQIEAGEGERPEGASGRGRNLSIEGLRGFSASIVILYHLHNMAILGGFSHPFPSRSVEQIIAGIGPFGVLLFFMISGYLILQSLIKYDNIPLFFKHRALRIYPCFLLLHLVIFILGPLCHYAWMGGLLHSPVLYAVNFASNLFFLPGILPLPLAQKNAWSLSYEFAFYLTAALLYFSLMRRAARPWLSRIMLLVGIVAAVAVLTTHPLAFFFLGGVAACLVERTRMWPRIKRFWLMANWSQASGMLLLGLTFTAFVGNALWLSVLLGAAFFATVVSGSGVFSLWLRTRPLQYLGRISYSLYLAHPFVLDPLRSAIHYLSPHLHSSLVSLILFSLLGFGGAVFVASLLYRFVEVGLTNRFLRRRVA